MKRTDELAEVEKVGGRIEVCSAVQGRPVILVDYSRSRITDAGLEHLKGCTQLRKLDLEACQVTDDDVEIGHI